MKIAQRNTSYAARLIAHQPQLSSSHAPFHSMCPLTTLRTDLLRRALRTHLALNPARLSTSLTLRALSLLGLLLALTLLLLVLALGDSFLAGCLASFGALRAAVFDEFERCADDASLLLYCSAGALLGDFL